MRDLAATGLAAACGLLTFAVLGMSSGAVFYVGTDTGGVAALVGTVLWLGLLTLGVYGAFKVVPRVRERVYFAEGAAGAVLLTIGLPLGLAATAAMIICALVYALIYGVFALGSLTLVYIVVVR